MIHPITPALYQTICEWWKSHSWPVLPQNVLSKRGYMAFIGEKPIISAYLFKDESCGFCLVEWITSNPESSSEERELALKELLDHISEEARKIGGFLLNAMVQNQNLVQRLIRNNFQISDTQMIHLQRPLIKPEA